MDWPTAPMDPMDAVERAALWLRQVDAAPKNSAADVDRWFVDARGITVSLSILPHMPVPANPWEMPAGMRRMVLRAMDERGHALLVPGAGMTLALHFVRDNTSQPLRAPPGDLVGWHNLPPARAFPSSFVPTHWEHMQDEACVQRCLPHTVILAETLADAWAGAAIGHEWESATPCGCGRESCRRWRRPVAAVCAGAAWNWPAWAEELARYTPTLRHVVILPEPASGWADKRLAAHAALGRRLAELGVTTVTAPWAWMAREGVEWGAGWTDVVAFRGEAEAARLLAGALGSLTNRVRSAA